MDEQSASMVFIGPSATVTYKTFLHAQNNLYQLKVAIPMTMHTIPLPPTLLSSALSVHSPTGLVINLLPTLLDT